MTIVSVVDRPTGIKRGIEPARGPVGDHTLCALVNDLRMCERRAWTHSGRTLTVTCRNVLPLSTGQVVNRDQESEIAVRRSELSLPRKRSQTGGYAETTETSVGLPSNLPGAPTTVGQCRS